MAALSNTDTRTTGAVYIPENWSDLVLYFREKNLGASRFFERRDQDVMNFGDKIHFPIPTEYNVYNYSDGDKLEDNLDVDTDGEKVLTIDLVPMRPFLVLDTLSAQSKYDKKAVNFKNAAYVIAKSIDTAILAQSASFTNSAINAAGTAITNLDLTEAMTTLDALDVPSEERAWFMHPTTIKDLMDLTGNYFTSIDFTGTQSLVNGEITSLLLGSRVVKTTNVPTGTTGSPAATYYKNIYAHKSAIGVAMQKNVQVQEEYSVNFQGSLCNVRALYGVLALRTDHGVIVNR